MRLGVFGAGAVGVRALRQWLATAEVEELLIADRDGQRAERAAASLAGKVRQVEPDGLVGLDAVVLAVPAPHASHVARHLRSGTAVVSVSDDIADIRDLLAMGALATDLALPLVVGAGFMPGLTLPPGALRRHRLRPGRRDPRRQARHRRAGLRPPAPSGTREHGDRVERGRLVRSSRRLGP